MEKPQSVPSIQSEEKRSRNFLEVSRGFTKRTTADESRRCPQCSDSPCQLGCPLEIDIKEFIRLLREGDTPAALNKIKEQNPLPGVCGRICLAPCETSCIFQDEQNPIGIRALERFAADHGRSRFMSRRVISKKGRRIAVVGGGPAGLSAAAELAGGGFQVTIFEAHPKAGGALRYGIPEFRLPHTVLDSEIDDIKASGVVIETNSLVGGAVGFNDLFQQGFAAILLTSGRARPALLDIPGMHLTGVYYAQELLMQLNLVSPSYWKNLKSLALGRKIAVIGSGAEALDCARACVRLGKEVSMVFDSTQEDIAVHPQDREYAKEEGVHYEGLLTPVEIMSDQNNCVFGLRCGRLDYADPESSGEWKVVEVPDSYYILDVDTVIVALGHEPAIPHPPGEMPWRKKGEFLWIDPVTGMTSSERIFAAGDIVCGGSVVEAIASGKMAAARIKEFFRKKVETSA